MSKQQLDKAKKGIDKLFARREELVAEINLIDSFMAQVMNNTLTKTSLKKFAPPAARAKKKKTMSASARRKISRAKKAYWAAKKKSKKPG